jgi:uncharacterized membrane protein (UPF0127 family)
LTRLLILAVAAGLLALTIACGNAATSVPPTTVPTEAPVKTPTNAPQAAATPSQDAGENPIEEFFVRVDDVVFPVELAATAEDRIRGLSGRSYLNSGTGMLFVFENAERFRFWMREIEIPLDIVWISSGCTVVDVSVDVPFPDPETPLNDLPRYSPEATAQYVLEINGGEALSLGVGAGDPVKFLGGLEGEYGC